MSILVGFGTFAALLEEQISEKVQPPHPCRRPGDDCVVEHRGRCPCRAAQSPK
jgi:hypothetical protein